MELRDLGGALGRHKLVVLLILVIAGLAVVVGLRLAPKTYTSTAIVSADPDPTAGAAIDDVDTLRATLAELAGSRSVVADVQGELDVVRGAEALGDDIRAEWVRGTTLIRITAEDRDPQVAADVANAVARVLPRQDASQAFDLSVEDPAEPAGTYTSPDRWLVLGAGAALAVLLAAAGALWRERRAGTVEDAATVEQATAAPLLAHLAPPRDHTTLPALSPGTQAAGVFRQLRLALETDSAGSPVGRVVVAGVTSQDVNVWLGANLAIALAGSGRRVLLVDGRLGERFGRPGPEEPDTPGLHGVLTGTPLSDALSPGPVAGLTVLPAGAWDIESAQSLVTTRFASAMAAAQERFDVVVVLGAPLDVCDDARVMAMDGGALLLVVPEGHLSPGALRAHAARVRSVGARLIGTVLVSRRPERVAD
ncbi:MAG: hypothetical protein LH468_06245 [Nocardioides sp.]|nr:hypothetical protein [Nocardioides sp.]